MKDATESTVPADWGYDEEEDMSEESISSFEDLIDRAFKLDQEIKEIELKEISPRKADLKEMDQRILATLKKHNKTSYRANAGMVVKTEKFSVKFPKNPDARQQVKDFMGEENYFNMAQIPYQSFNAWCKQKHEQAVESGNLDYQIPGCEAPTYVEYLSRRK